MATLVCRGGWTRASQPPPGRRTAMHVRTAVVSVVLTILVACLLFAVLALQKYRDPEEHTYRSSQHGKPSIHARRRYQDNYERWALSVSGGHGTINDVPEEAKKLTYSVIVVESNPHPSNLFRETERLSAYSRYNVTSVQFADPKPVEELPFKGGLQPMPPFYVEHPVGVDRRVRIVHIADFGRIMDELSDHQVSHLKAACKDIMERTLVMITDETCDRLPLPSRLPPACWANIVRHYPYNAPSATSEQRNAYVPLGPRDSFTFVQPARRSLASERRLFFNLAVSRETSRRRNDVIDGAVAYYEEKGDEFEAFVEGPHLEAEEYQQLLLDSKFTLCPGGHNPETFRMFEALEAGSIPIVSREDYLDPDYRAPHPCGEGKAAWNTVAASPYAQAVSVDTWDDLPRLLDDLLSMPEGVLNMLQAACLAWYELLMARTYESLLNFGDGHEMWPQGGPILAEG